MTIIIVDNIYATLDGTDKEIDNTIWEKLCYEIKEFKAEYVQRRHLYNRKTHKTYTGLLPYVLQILEDMDEEYKINDLRVKPQVNANYNILPEFQARDYQQDIIDDCEHREIIRAATGGGKTFMMAGIIAKFKTKPVAIFADKLSLCTQLQSEISKFLGEEVGLVGGGINDKKDITVYSVQSATENDVKDVNMVLFDECFPADALVNIGNNQYKTIKEIVDNKLQIQIPSYNIEKKEIEYNPIINWGKKENKEDFYRITITDEEGQEHSFICTENHKIFANNTYIKAKDLQINDEVVICKD